MNRFSQCCLWCIFIFVVGIGFFQCPLRYLVADLFLGEQPVATLRGESGPASEDGVFVLDIHDLLPAVYHEPSGPAFEHPESAPTLVRYISQRDSKLHQLQSAVADGYRGEVASRDEIVLKLVGHKGMIRTVGFAGELLIAGSRSTALRVAEIVEFERLKSHYLTTVEHCTFLVISGVVCLLFLMKKHCRGMCGFPIISIRRIQGRGKGEIG